MASLSQGRTAAAQCGLFTYKSVPVMFEPPCTLVIKYQRHQFTVFVPFEYAEETATSSMIRFTFYYY